MKFRLQYDIWDRPHYAYGIHFAAQLARTLRLDRISVLEFGVAGGRGLCAMERIAAEIADHLHMQIDVYGFDSGEGMPEPIDYRDLPHVWREGYYAMDVEDLRSTLDRARLILGDVSRTVPDFLSKDDVAPIGFCAFDLDYYSSTRHAFEIFNGSVHSKLPRVICYFDDTIGPEQACHNEYIGELCAIREFNDEHSRQKITKFQHLSWLRSFPARWNEQIYIFSDFDHPLYGEPITSYGEAESQLPL